MSLDQIGELLMALVLITQLVLCYTFMALTHVLLIVDQSLPKMGITVGKLRHKWYLNL